MFEFEDGIPEICTSREVVEELRGIVKGLPPQRHYLIQFDINKFSDYYNEYGPEQSNAVIVAITEKLQNMTDGLRVQYAQRIKEDQFVLLAGEVQVADEITAWAAGTVFPLVGAIHLTPHQSPQRIAVHTGVLAFKPGLADDLEHMVTRLGGLCQEGYHKTPPIAVDYWD